MGGWIGEDGIDGCGLRWDDGRRENHHQNRVGHIRPTRHAAPLEPRITSSNHDHQTLPQPCESGWASDDLIQAADYSSH